MAVGDDSSDEPMFQQVNRLATENETGDLAAFSITVGKKPSAAQSYLDDPSMLMDLLSTLGRSAQRENRYFSAVDLRQMDPTSSGGRGLAGGVSRGFPPRTPHADDTFNSGGTTGGLSLASPAAGGRARTLTPENRAMSVGNLALSAQGGGVKGEKGGTGGLGMSRTGSSAHLTMSSYLESIKDDNDDDDTGLFF